MSRRKHEVKQLIITRQERGISKGVWFEVVQPTVSFPSDAVQLTISFSSKAVQPTRPFSTCEAVTSNSRSPRNASQLVLVYNTIKLEKKNENTNEGRGGGDWSGERINEILKKERGKRYQIESKKEV